MNGEHIQFVTTKPKAEKGSLGLKTQAPGMALTVSAVAAVSDKILILE